MRLKFCGAAECVTGSCHLLEVNNKKILLDCGLYQGKDAKDWGNEKFSFNPKEIDYVLLSHAHIDHSGRIPLLYKKGFKGKVVCTKATMDLCNVMLPDSGHIQEMEIDWKNRKRMRLGLNKIEPLYTSIIAKLSTYLFEGYEYDEFIELFQGVKLRFRDAGHLLGSAIIELYIKEENQDEVKIVYTGDLGNVDIPIIEDPTHIEYADYIIMETTYGDRYHKDISKDSMAELVKIIDDTFKNGGNVIIPSFAVGRAQEIIYALNKYIKNDDLKNLRVYLDSPLASESTQIFKKHVKCYDKEAKNFIVKGYDPLDFQGLIFTKTPQESSKVNKIQSGAVVISASGMCEAGRIKHHLKHNLWRKECSVVFVGYQAEGTLGRSILDGAKKVKIFGEDIAVNAKIYNIEGLSGHADRKGLYNWIRNLNVRPHEIFLVHGDKLSQKRFKKLLISKGFNCKTMKTNQQYFINEKDRVNGIGRKERIIKLLDEMENIESLNEREILAKIKTVLY